jgi:uncharacterized membrane protein YraQ (UPF0718 family)
MKHTDDSRAAEPDDAVAVPAKPGRKRNWPLLIFALAALGLGAVAYLQGGLTRLEDGLLGAGRTLLITAPLIVLAFVLAGLVGELISEEMASRWLGDRSGLKGILLASAAGAMVPGGPYVYYPMALMLFRSGASVGVVVAFIVGKNVWGLTRLPMEFALLGPTIALSRILATLVVPPTAGLVAQLLFKDAFPELRGPSAGEQP